MNGNNKLLTLAKQRISNEYVDKQRQKLNKLDVGSEEWEKVQDNTQTKLIKDFIKIMKAWHTETEIHTERSGKYVVDIIPYDFDNPIQEVPSLEEVTEFNKHYANLSLEIKVQSNELYKIRIVV